MRVLVLVLTAEERLIDLDLALQRPVKRTGAGRVPEPMEHEPSSLLGHVQVTGELRAGDPLPMRRDQRNGREPLAYRDFAVLENGPDADAETGFAVAAFVSAV